jgi:ABC-type lipoprotein release transport system permease subunit
VSTQNLNRPLKSLEPIIRDQKQLKQILDSEFIIKPFWNEYEFLIEAVKVEKFSISLILQLIVVVAVFNIIAFVIYIMEKKAQDFFFLRAVGLAIKDMTRFWFISVILIWAVSCVGAYFFTEFFDWSLQHLSLFKIPGDIYVLSGLNLRLNFKSYLTVYAISLLWILIATMVGYLRFKRKTIIQGLRQEFSS